MNGLTLKLLAYNIWTTFLEGAPSTTGNLDKNVNEIAVEIVNFITGIATGGAAIAIACCGFLIMGTREHAETGKKWLPRIFIGFAIVSLVWVITGFIKAKVAVYQ